MTMEQAQSEKKGDFWSNNPCGTTGSLANKQRQRYRMEPWVPILLRDKVVRSGGKTYLEVGCGQGADAYYSSTLLDEGSQYIALDYSPVSLEQAKQTLGEAKELGLKVEPQFVEGSALELPYESEHFDVVYSMGVIHHTPDPQKGIDEVHRVLKKGGEAYICLYRRWSLKLFIAKSLRAFQKVVDFFTRKERTLYHLFKGNYLPDSLGTMLLECFGVPYMYCYTQKELEQMFKNFEHINIRKVGYNLPNIRPGGDGENFWGWFWIIEAKK